MKLIMVLLALLYERFFEIKPRVPRFTWFAKYRSWLQAKLNSSNVYVEMLCLIAPLPIIIYCLNDVFRDWFYGLGGIAIGAASLIYALGPNNLFAVFTRYVEARQLDNKEEYLAAAKTMLGDNASELNQLDHKVNLHALTSFNSNVFTPVFWFVLFGPSIAIAYRLINLATEYFTQLQVAVDVIEWLPARLLSLCYGLGGHFIETFDAWRRGFVRGLSANASLLTECGSAALGLGTAADDDEGQTLEQIQNTSKLLDLCLWIGMLLFAVIVIL